MALEPFLIAGQEIAFRHAEQQAARRGVGAVVAVSHAMPHAGRPFQSPVAIGIIAVGLGSRGVQEMLIHLVGLVVQPDHVHLPGHPADFERQAAPHVPAAQLMRGGAPGIRPAGVG
jgi:hypothetical protein